MVRMPSLPRRGLVFGFSHGDPGLCVQIALLGLADGSVRFAQSPLLRVPDRR
jgi:hypothetical protein